MARKSVYLFSVAILGFSIVPSSSAWADEMNEQTTSNVTTELIAGTEEVTAETAREQPVSESAPTQTEIQATDENQNLEEVSTDSELTEPIQEPETSILDQSESIEPAVETPAIAENSELELAETEPTADNVAIEPASAAAPVTTKNEGTPLSEEKSTNTSTPALLMNDNDGKIVEHEKAITDENAKIPKDYEFMPNFSKAQDIVVDGTKNYVYDGYTYVFDLDSEKPNTITVTYKNVGSYKGKVIDMRITVKGWTALAGKQVLYINKDNGITMNGIRDLLLNYSFLDALTENSVKLSGFFNFTDIDLKQSIDLFNNNNVQNFYVTKNNQLYFKTFEDYIRIGEINNAKTNHMDMNHWLTYTYKNVSGFDVRYNQDYETNAVFNYSFKLPLSLSEMAPGVIDPTIPVDVEDLDEAAPEENTEQEEKTSSTDSVMQPETQAPTTIKTGSWIDTVSHYTAQASQQTALPQTKPTELPKTNERSSSILSVFGGMCIMLFTALFLHKKKS